jgi:hypothetical protein
MERGERDGKYWMKFVEFREALKEKRNGIEIG